MTKDELRQQIEQALCKECQKQDPYSCSSLPRICQFVQNDAAAVLALPAIAAVEAVQEQLDIASVFLNFIRTRMGDALWELIKQDFQGVKHDQDG